MNIYINGVNIKINNNKNQINISDILIYLHHSRSRISIFLNGVLVQKAEWEDTILNDNDQIESIELIAGG